MPFQLVNTAGALRKNIPNFKGGRNPFFGKKHSEETKRKLSIAMKGKLEGDKHPRWKGGKTLRFWTRKIKERDDFTCQKCGLKDARIVQADHVKSKKLYPELISELENGITLCPNCHSLKTYFEDLELKEHRRNQSKKQW